MKGLAKAAVLVAPMVISLAMVGATPALADGGSCNWANSNGSVSSFPAGTTVAANGVVFSCSAGGSSNPGNNVWIPAGTTQADNTPGLVTWYDGTQNPAGFTAGATLLGDDDSEAWVLGSAWDDVGSFSDFQDGLTQCVGASCSDSGPGGLMP